MECYNFLTDGNEYENGKLMRKKISDNCKMIFFHITADSILMDHFTKGFMEDGPLDVQIAGAGSGIPVDGTMGKVGL